MDAMAGLSNGAKGTEMIVIINKCSLISDADAQRMTAAVAKQVVEFATDWGMLAVDVRLGTTESPTAYNIYLLDDPDQQDALGYHWEGQDGVKRGRVFARPVFDAGGWATTGKLSVSSVLSHEVLESFADPDTNLWADALTGSIAYEVCDPCESNTYQIDGVTVSDFVLPTWFDVYGKGPYSKCGAAPGPFKLAPGGYYVERGIGDREMQVFGNVPAYRAAEVGSRLTKRKQRLRSMSKPW